jgi:hypothetical protein
VNITTEEIEALRTLGYLVGDDVNGAVLKFKTTYLAQLVAPMRATSRGVYLGSQWDEFAALALAQRMSVNSCGVSDIQRAEDGSIIEEARWPPSCAEINLSVEFTQAPGLTEHETLAGILFCLAQWNTAFHSPTNGRWYPELIEEYMRLCKLHGVPLDTAIYVLWGGTFGHEVGHALGLNHTPSDRNSLLFPSMGGQYMLNRTDVANLYGRGYSKSQPITLSLVDWADRAIELPDFGDPQQPPTPKPPGNDPFDGLRVHFEDAKQDLYGSYRIVREQ